MASNFRPTGSYSNLTRLELERVRRADAWASGKTLTIGDSGEGSENVVGPGLDVAVEPVPARLPFYTESHNPITPPSAPGPYLSTTTQVCGVPSETVAWFGPILIYDAYLAGRAIGVGSWQDLTPGLNFQLFVQAGDILLIKNPGALGADNRYATARVTSVLPDTLTCTPINAPIGSATQFYVDGIDYSYVIVRPNAVKLFAAPWSGATGAEQTFFMVEPGALVHSMLAPTIEDLLSESISNIVDPSLGTGDRADAVYPSPAPMSELREMGYRVVFYPDNGLGTGPDITKPILATHPVINPAIPSSDQGISIDYRAGAVRLSCAPMVGGDIKPTTGCVDPVTGRLNLYAVYWAVDTSQTQRTVAGLYSVRGDEQVSRAGARVWFDTLAAPDQQAWWLSSSPTRRGAFVQDFTNAPARIGVDTKAGSCRHLTYDNVRAEWQMRVRGLPTDYTHEDVFDPTLADRTLLTMSDSAYEPQHPGLVTPGQVVASPAQGFRNSADDINAQLQAAAQLGYGTVHLRKGTHVVDSTIHIPPGVTLEGAGPQTKLEKRGPGSPLLKFGPNTPWGVYDFSYTPGTTYAPTAILSGIKNRRIEGQDICWNANKKVWGVVIADVTSQAVWFNEMRLDGTWVFPGNGIDIKNNVRQIFTTDAAPFEDAQQRHTPGHHPRIAYQPYLNRYGAAWCVLDSAILQRSALQTVLWEVDAEDAVTILHDQIREGANDRYLNPSVAFNQYDAADTSLRVAHYRGSIMTWGVQVLMQEVGSSTISLLVPTTSRTIVSSIDISVAADGWANVVWTERAHALLGPPSGVASGVIDASTPRQFSSADLASPVSSGVVVGSKLHHLNSVVGSAQGGTDYVITAVYGTYVEIQSENEATELPATESNFWWAISPPARIYASRHHPVSGWSGAKTVVVDGHPVASMYNAEMREPDFVRISDGDSGCLIVFQAFNTTAFLARTSLRNFDNNVDANFFDGQPICKSTDGVYREHVSACSCLLESNLLYNAVPGQGEQEPYGTYALMAAPLRAAAKSLGASEPLVGSPNGLVFNVTSVVPPNQSYGQKRGPHLEISARHIVHKWTVTQPMSLLPDVTWTGQDWAIVSPTLSKIESDTGTIRVIGGNHYLVDPTFCFGNGAPNSVDGNWLPRTISGDIVILNGTPTEYSIHDAISEHCVRFSFPTPFTDGTRVSWRMSSALPPFTSAWNRDAGLKIQGFRVASDGTLIQGSSRLLDYMPPNMSPNTTFTRVGGKMETVSRRQRFTHMTPNVSTGGGNDPMMFGTLGPHYNGTGTSMRGGWNHDYPTSRISGNIGWQGVVAGAPMPPGGVSPYECPMVALAWGETFYALMQRQTSGQVYWANRTLVYRQSFGPYNAEARNLALFTQTSLEPNWAGTAARVLQPVTRRHVFTRWGLPNTPSGGFATDGYRNCFVYANQMGQPNTAVWPITSYDSYQDTDDRTTLRWTAAYTDAVGNSPIHLYGHRSARVVDPILYTPSVIAFPGNDCQLREDLSHNPLVGVYPSSPVVLWTGSHFAAFWTEEDKSDVFADGVHVLAGSYICMAMFPGGEATNLYDTSLGSAYDSPPFVPNLSAMVKVSCGLAAGSGGTGEDVFSNQITVCDAAFNGRNFGVVWVAGLYKNMTVSGLRAGTALGVTIFTDGSPNGGGTSYLIETADASHGSPGIRQPKLVWDGLNYVLFWTNHNRDIFCLSVPETGLGSPTQIKRIASENMILGDYGDVRTLGILDAQGNILPGAAGDQGLACQPGDIVHIDKLQRVEVRASLMTGQPYYLGNSRNFYATGHSGFIGDHKIFSDLLGASVTFTRKTFQDPAIVSFAGVRAGSQLVILAPPRAAGTYTVVAVDAATLTLTILEDFHYTGLTTAVDYYVVEGGVRPGDHLVIGTPSANNGRYIITKVISMWELQVDSPFQVAGETGKKWWIERRHDLTRLAGPHLVRDYDPITGKIGLETRGSEWLETVFDPGDMTSTSSVEVVGSIVSGGLGRSSVLPKYGSKYDATLPKSGLSYDARKVRTADTVAERILSVIYLDPEEDFAYLYHNTDGTYSIGRASRSNLYTMCHTVGFACRYATMAWNGKNLLVVYLQRDNSVRYALYSPNLTLLESDSIASGPYGGSATSQPLGNGVGQVPGPLYDNLVAPADMQWGDPSQTPVGQLQPRPKKAEVKWNDRLGRWVVSVSYVWGMEGSADWDYPTSYANNPPMWPLKYDGTLVTADIEQPCSIGIGGTYVGRVLTGRFYVPLIQPGMRLYVQDGSTKQVIQFTVMKLGPRVVDPNPNGVTPTDIYTSLTVDVNVSELTPTEVGYVTADGIAYRMWTEAREDVFVWTLQQGQPAVQLIDADGCALRNVLLGGSCVDISEQYYGAARPTWRSSGEVTGAAALVASGEPGRVVKRPYIHSFLTPESKIETLRLSDCRSRTPVKYGRHGPPRLPGKPEGGRS